MLRATGHARMVTFKRSNSIYLDHKLGQSGSKATSQISSSSLLILGISLPGCAAPRYPGKNFLTLFGPASRVTKRQTAHSTVNDLGNFLALEP